QAEGRIRDRNVTGVQACALPIQVRLLPEVRVERRPRRPHAGPVLLLGRDAERPLELLQERLGLELRLDGDLLRDRDQQAAPLDQPPDDVLVAPLDHAASRASPALSAAASSPACAPWRSRLPPPRSCPPPGRTVKDWCARACRRARARRGACPPRSPGRAA